MPAEPTPTEPLEWAPLWQDDRFGGWTVESAHRTTDGWERENLRLRLGQPGQDFAGSVCVPLRTTDRGLELLFVRQERPAPGVLLWELPRGGAEPGETPSETALRELEEETGWTADSCDFLGFVFPDSGILASRVGVCAAAVSSQGVADTDHPETLGSSWFTLPEVRRLLRAGEIRDGITLSALMLFETAQEG